MKLLKSHALIVTVLEILDVRPEKENEKEKGREKGTKKDKVRSRGKNPVISVTIFMRKSKMEAARMNNRKQAAQKRRGN
jgi:hypothetical protein